MFVVKYQTELLLSAVLRDNFIFFFNEFYYYHSTRLMSTFIAHGCQIFFWSCNRNGIAGVYERNS